MSLSQGPTASSVLLPMRPLLGHLETLALEKAPFLDAEVEGKHGKNHLEMGHLVSDLGILSMVLLREPSKTNKVVFIMSCPKKIRPTETCTV